MDVPWTPPITGLVKQIHNRWMALKGHAYSLNVCINTKLNNGYLAGHSLAERFLHGDTVDNAYK